MGKNKVKKKAKRQAKREQKAAKLLHRTLEPGYLGNLDESMQAALAEFKSRPAAIAANHLSDGDFLRFLRARDFDVNAADTLLTQAEEYFQREKPDQIQLANVRLFYDRGVAFQRGFDRCGRPTFWTNAGLHDPSRSDEAIQHSLYMLHECLRNLPPNEETFTAVFDLTEYTRANSDLNWTRKFVGAVQNSYPERLGCCLILNAPWVFKFLWNAIKPMLSQRTSDKIVFIGGDYKDKLKLYFDDDNLLHKYGGKNKFDVVKWIVDELGPPPEPVETKKSKGWFGWLKGSSSSAPEEEEDDGKHDGAFMGSDEEDDDDDDDAQD